MSPKADVTVVGAGLAGCEAALQMARRGMQVRLIERKPESRSAAAHIDGFAELVCSNSLRGRALTNAVGLLKQEMARLGSFFMAAAYATEVPAGGALAVDREAFSAWLTERINQEPNIELVCSELADLPEEGELILATGPLTGGKLAESIAKLTGSDQLHFYDAIAPIVEADSVDMNTAFFQSRYDKGDGADYLNLPMNEAEYRAFVEALVAAEKVQPHDFEKPKYFEGCLPVDIMAERGPDTLSYGPLKPVGLTDPRTGRRPFAVIQLRTENKDRTAFNLVGFQNRLTHPAQERVLRSIPGLQAARFLRLGSVHRNTFIDAPSLLDEQLRLKQHPRISLAGQISGVEGYVESAACGLLAGLYSAGRHLGQPLTRPPEESMLGGMIRYLLTEQKSFQPSNVNFSMLPALEIRIRSKKDRKMAVAKRAEEALEAWIESEGLDVLGV